MKKNILKMIAVAIVVLTMGSCAIHNGRHGGGHDNHGGGDHNNHDNRHN